MTHFFGIDVALEKLDCFNPNQGLSKFENKQRPILAFLKTLPPGAVLAMESTGGYGTLLAELACKMGFEVYIIQPAKINHHRKAGPDRSKTDRIDAKVIQDYIQTYHHRLHPYQPLPEFEARLRKVFRTRSGLMKKAASIRQQLRSLGDSRVEIDRTLKGMNARIEELNRQIESLLDSDPDAKLLATIPCVKACTIAAVLPVLRTIEFKNKYALDSWAGMDLKARESGKSRGRRHMSKEGDKYIRRAAFLAAMSGVRSKAWRDYYAMLINEKKLKRVQALNALARKILHTIFGVYRSRRPFAMQGG